MCCSVVAVFVAMCVAECNAVHLVYVEWESKILSKCSGVVSVAVCVVVFGYSVCLQCVVVNGHQESCWHIICALG